MTRPIRLPVPALVTIALAAAGLTLPGCAEAAPQNGSADRGAESAGTDRVGAPSSTASTTGAASGTDYCELPAIAATVLETRPSASEPPVDDVNWFARPVPHDGDDHIIAFATHNQNHLYNLSTGARIRIPDRSDAVATPDGRYMTVPSYYTPDSTVRFYPVAPMLERLDRGEDAGDLEPAFVHDHPAMKRVYYQSTGVLSDESTTAGDVTTYRLMFSGTQHQSGFRVVDYRFTHDGRTGALLGVDATEPMALCPLIRNDLNTPFISKDGRHVAAYTSEREEPGYAPGASLKLFRITSIDPGAGTTTCERVADLGFAAGKADFSFDGRSLTFHTSQGGYLTPFVNGGLSAGTITDVAVARLDVDANGNVRGHSGVQRLTTSFQSGVGSYFPAFFPDGTLFYIANAVPRESEADKRFHFRVLDPTGGNWKRPALDTREALAAWHTIATLWERSCTPGDARLDNEPFPHASHEAPWLGLALTASQCHALLDDASRAGFNDGADASTPDRGADAVDRDKSPDWDGLGRFCEGLGADPPG